MGYWGSSRRKIGDGLRGGGGVLPVHITEPIRLLSFLFEPKGL